MDNIVSTKILEEYAYRDIIYRYSYGHDNVVSKISTNVKSANVDDNVFCSKYKETVDDLLSSSGMNLHTSYEIHDNECRIITNNVTSEDKL